MPDSEPIALIDMDGTVADFDGAMRTKLAELAGPRERKDPETLDRLRKEPWMAARRSLIKSQPGFWRNLKPLFEGMEVVRLMRQIGFRLVVLTKGPHQTTGAWTEKVEWAREWITDAGVCIVDDTDSGKGLVYGKVLFDDWPAYIESWLKWRPRGLVIMTDQVWNRDFTHPNVVRFSPVGGQRSLSGQRQDMFLRDKLQAAYDR